jgi:hypothetical protein
MKHGLFMRVFWFGVGGGVSICLNPALFTLFHDVLHWSNYFAYALSLTLVNVLQFLWNYFVGFRTNDHWTTSAKKQGVTLALANGLNYVLVILLQGIFPNAEKLVIVAVQILMAIFKFFAYHYWVYPRSSAPIEECALKGSPPDPAGNVMKAQEL